MREYHEVFGHELPPLSREPVLSNFYTPTDEQRVGIHSVEYDWNQRSSVLSRELIYIMNRNITDLSFKNRDSYPLEQV